MNPGVPTDVEFDRAYDALWGSVWKWIKRHVLVFKPVARKTLGGLYVFRDQPLSVVVLFASGSWDRADDVAPELWPLIADARQELAVRRQRPKPEHDDIELEILE